MLVMAEIGIAQPTTPSPRPIHANPKKSVLASSSKVRFQASAPTDEPLPRPRRLDSIEAAPTNLDAGAQPSELWQDAHSTGLPIDGDYSASDCCVWGLGNLLDPRRFEIFAGVQDFSGPGNYQFAAPNAAAGGSHGFQEGFQWSTPMPWIFFGTFTGQAGLRATQTHLEGSPLSDNSRRQLFLTTGMFRRVDYGLQGGAVVDYMDDDWFYRATLVQARGETSFRFGCSQEVGFRFAVGTQKSTSQELAIGTAPISTTWAALDTYRFFYRQRFGECEEGAWEANLGVTEKNDFVMGFFAEAPLRGRLGWQVSGNYLIPDSSQRDGFRHESWNLGLAFVLTPGRCFGRGNKYERPLLPVADNGSFLAHRL